MVFFQRKGESLPITNRGEDHVPGDLMTWDLGGNVPHIGIVVDQKARSSHYMIVHNIGEGPKMEDVLFNWKISPDTIGTTARACSDCALVPRSTTIQP